MKKSLKYTVLYGTTLLLAACANTPMGPTVQVMPPPGKPFEQFQADQAVCKQFAEQQIQGQAERANTTGLLEGIGGTALGAGLGAALGGGHGAAVGAAGGAIVGTGVGASTSGQEQHGIQQQYNNAYQQCMSTKGNHAQAPVMYAPQTTVIYTPAPPPTVVYTTAPPPVGYPPPY